MYKPTKLEQQYFKHQMQAHGGKTLQVCPFCRVYQKKIEETKKQYA